MAMKMCVDYRRPAEHVGGMDRKSETCYRSIYEKIVYNLRDNLDINLIIKRTLIKNVFRTIQSKYIFKMFSFYFQSGR